MPANASGTPTTNYGFYTLNPSVDAPNGTGLNTIITSIDTAMKTKNDSQDAAIAAIVPGASLALAVAMS
jgi:hypothetical protein